MDVTLEELQATLEPLVARGALSLEDLQETLEPLVAREDDEVLVGDDPCGPETLAQIVNVPNAITLAGFMCTLGWIAGGPAWLAIAGLVADELDGRAARALGQSSRFGSLFDWTVDVVSSAMVMVRLGRPLMIAPMLLGQIVLRENEWRPPVGSARAVLTVYALATGR